VLLPFGRLACAAFLLYGIGYIVPLLRRDLGIGDSLAGLHASAVAIGTLLAGALGERLMRRLGDTVAPRLAMLGIALAGIVVAFAPNVALTLSGALLFGAAGGVTLSWVNHRLTAPGGHEAAVAIAQVNLIGLVAALASPIAISTADGLGVNGRLAMLVPLPLVLGLEAIHWRSAGSPDVARAVEVAGPSRPTRRLPNAYWRAWLVIVVSVALEFTIVYWGASLIDLRTGAGTAQATTAAAGFLLGMIAARIALAAGFGTRASRWRLTTVALGAVAAGALVTWQAPTPLLGAFGLFVAGMGVGPLYPLAITHALSLVREAPEAAAARATLATGVALIGAPFLLAVTAERIGLVNAWPLVAVAAIVAVGIVATTRGDAAPPI
jgi:MFS family permease